MRYPAGHKEAVRTAIVAHASPALRRDGIHGVSIPALMKRVGLTHGGFYAHFADRDELVAEAITTAAEATGKNVLSAEAGDLQSTLERYLSRDHVEHPEHGCVVAALGGEGHRQSTPVRKAFARASRGLIAYVDAKLRGSPKPSARPTDEGLELAAKMVGAIVLARLVDDDALATRLLSAARRLPTPA